MNVRQWLILLGLLLCAVPSRAGDNVLTAEEAAAGWLLLFDGKTTSGWMTPKKAALPPTHVQEACLNPHPTNYMLVHEKEWGDFELQLDFKLSPGCNTGVFFRTSPLMARPGKDIGHNGLEVAVDDTKTAGMHDTGAIYDLVPPTKNMMRPTGEWNHLVLKCVDHLITVDVNGEIVTRMDLNQFSEPFVRGDGSRHKFDVAYKTHPRVGYIGLQDHGGDCWYKNIKIRPLEKSKRVNGDK